MNASELGRQVNRRRKEKRLTQEELARRANISRNYISLIERGEAKNVSVNVLNELAKVLDTSPAQLSGQDGWADTLISPILREFALKENLGFDVVDKLSRLPMRGKEPQTVEEWQELYLLIKVYME